jgi:hypothetical protein
MAQQGTQDDLDTVEHVRTSAASVAQALKGIDFPAGKDKLIAWARNHNAPQEVLEMLQKMPSRGEYENMADVLHNLGRAK